MDIAEKLVKKCIDKNLTVAAAESLTGGALCASIVSVAGASAFLKYGIVCYTNEAKHELLGVKENTLIRFGAVSEQTASEMLDGLTKSGADIMIATTGLAGPTGDGFCDDVGLVYVGIAFKGQKNVYKRHYSGGRNEIRAKAVTEAIELCYEIIK